jgi:2-dehydro-3-deoxyphosphogluconate aldolase/(4S)-4-hydroxy-2-oxoglutarate aldolase
VRTRADAIHSLDAGAQFVVSPGTIADVLESCAERGVPAIPGACTPTEIEAALAGGAGAVKLFPIEASGGLALVRSLAGPFRDVPFLPTGGVDAINLAAYLRAPGVVACGGTWLVARALVEEGRFDRIEELTREAASIVATTRTETVRA